MTKEEFEKWRYQVGEVDETDAEISKQEVKLSKRERQRQARILELRKKNKRRIIQSMCNMEN